MRVSATWAGILVVALAGCGRDPFAEATPDEAGLVLEITGSALEGVATQGLSAQGLQSTSQGLAAPGEYLQNAREALAWLNTHVRLLVEPIAELIRDDAPNTLPGDIRVYGPRDHGAVTYRLLVKRVTIGRFTWRLDAKPLGADDAAYVPVMAGGVQRGLRAHRGVGVLGIDLDALKVIDPSLPGAGKLFCGFAHLGDSKTLVYGLKGFTPNVAVHEPIDAAFAGHRLMPSGATAVRMASHYNLADSPTAAKELVRSRVRWLPGVGGRADVLATGGDIPADRFYLGSGCWDRTENEGYAVLRNCSRALPRECVIVREVGEVSNCAPALPESLPPEDVGSTTPEDGTPSDEVTPPTEMPDGGF